MLSLKIICLLRFSVYMNQLYASQMIVDDESQITSFTNENKIIILNRLFFTSIVI